MSDEFKKNADSVKAFTPNPEIYKGLVDKLGYALRSDIDSLVSVVYGRASMAQELGVITWDQFEKINIIAIRYYANGGTHRHERAERAFNEMEW